VGSAGGTRSACPVEPAARTTSSTSDRAAAATASPAAAPRASAAGSIRKVFPGSVTKKSRTHSASSLPLPPAPAFPGSAFAPPSTDSTLAPGRPSDHDAARMNHQDPHPPERSILVRPRLPRPDNRRPLGPFSDRCCTTRVRRASGFGQGRWWTRVWTADGAPTPTVRRQGRVAGRGWTSPPPPEPSHRRPRRRQGAAEPPLGRRPFRPEAAMPPGPPLPWSRRHRHVVSTVTDVEEGLRFGVRSVQRR
jgi:hypothetical protein